MKILLLVQREAGADIPAWIEDACDEYTLDEWNGAMPDSMRKKLEADPENFRSLWVQIPDDALDRLWDVPTVKGEVLPSDSDDPAHSQDGAR